MIPINYVYGDATKPFGVGPILIAHVCNTDGAWGAGFVLALSKRSLEPERSYLEWHRTRDLVPENFLYRTAPFKLGEIKITGFEPPGVYVANMLAQTLAPGMTGIPLDYYALSQCLTKLREVALAASCSVHMPRIGCGLAGGHWSRVGPMIVRYLCAFNVEVVVYDLP